MESKEGQCIPDVTFRTRRDGTWQDVTTHELFAGMFVDDGVIKKMFIEPDQEGDPFEVSDADTMLRYLDPRGRPPHDVVMFTKPGCSYCAKAKQLLEAKGWAYDEVPASPRRLRAVSARSSTPQVFVDGQYIGGADELEKFLATAE